MKTVQIRKQTKNQILVQMSLLIALSYLGSLIKIQGSIALDALPAYYGALMLGPLPGAVIGILGHLLTALTSGFPMTLPLHLFVACSMGVTVGLFGYLAKNVNQILAVAAGVLFNGPVSIFGAAYIASLMGLGFSGKIMFYALIVPLTLTSAVNVLGGLLLYRTVVRYIRQEKIHEVS